MTKISFHVKGEKSSPWVSQSGLESWVGPDPFLHPYSQWLLPKQSCVQNSKGINDCWTWSVQMAPISQDGLCPFTTIYLGTCSFYFGECHPHLCHLANSNPSRANSSVGSYWTKEQWWCPKGWPRKYSLLGANSWGSFLLQLDKRVLIGLLDVVYMLTTVKLVRLEHD